MDAFAASQSCPYSYEEYEMDDDEKDNLKIVEKGSLVIGLLDEEAKEMMEGEGDLEEREVLAEIEEAEAQKQTVTAQAAEAAEAGGNGEDDDHVQVCNLRSDFDLEIYRHKLLEADITDLPPSAGDGEVGLYHLGGDLFLHVIERLGEEPEILLQISRLCREDLKEDDEQVCGCPSLVLRQEQWDRLLYMKKKVAKLIWSVQAERFVDEKYHIGKEVYMSITHPYRVVNIRSFFRKTGQSVLYPSKRGVALRFPQYDRLLQLEETIRCHQDVLTEKKLDEEFDAIKRKKDDEPTETEGNLKKRKVLEPSSPALLTKESSKRNQESSSAPLLLRRMKSGKGLKLNLENLPPENSHADDVISPDGDDMQRSSPPLTRQKKRGQDLKSYLEKMKEMAQNKFRVKNRADDVTLPETDDDSPIKTSCRRQAGKKNAVADSDQD